MREERQAHFDSLRAVFCIIVASEHFWYSFASFYYDNKVFLYNDGNLAVIYFLMLSGLVMPLGIFKGKVKKESIVRLSVDYIKKRYLRLLPIVSITVILSWLVFNGGGYYNQIVAQQFSAEVLTRSFSFTKSEMPLSRAIYEGFIGAFFDRTELNNPLWTIHYEFIGLCISYPVVLLLYRNEWRIWIYIALLGLDYVLFGDLYYVVVFSGVVISDFFFNENSLDCLLKRAKNKIMKMNLTWISLGAFLLVYSLTLLDFYSSYFKYICIMIAMIGLINSDIWKKILNNKILFKISEYSFEIYALHWPIMCSFSCWLMLKLKPYFSYQLECIVVFAVSIISVGICSYMLKNLLKFGKNLIRASKEK